jgi:hypothetical protein
MGHTSKESQLISLGLSWRAIGETYLLMAMVYFMNLPEVYAVPNQETTTVADALVNNFFCQFGVPMELYSD